MRKITPHVLVSWLPRSLAERLLVVVTALIVVIGVWARFYHLGSITGPIFDEVYFPVFANKFLHSQMAFDVHPPLGKFLIAIGIALFGDNGFGWRIIPALFGTSLLALVVWIWRQQKGGLVGSVLLVLFLSLDGLMIVYSRTGLIDSMLVFFILLAFGLTLRLREGDDTVWISTVLGLAVAIKWIALGVLVPIVYILWRRRKLLPFLISIPWGVWVYLLITVGAQVIGQVPHPWQAMLEWHQQALDYHLKLTATHPWSSPWWTWPLLLRPVLFWYEAVGDKVQVITALGNPLLWWASSLGVVAGVGIVGADWWKRRKIPWDHPLIPLLLGYFAFWLPWSLVHRVVFLYHYIPAYVFALLILVYELEVMWKRWSVAVVVVIAGIITACGLYFLPLAVGIPLSQQELNARVWITPSQDKQAHDPNYKEDVWWHGWMTN